MRDTTTLSTSLTAASSIWSRLADGRVLPVVQKIYLKLLLISTVCVVLAVDTSLL